jgi:hypothetical protein
MRINGKGDLHIILKVLSNEKIYRLYIAISLKI